MNKQYLDFCLQQIKSYDDKWIKRNRKIDTTAIFNTMLQGLQCNIGISTLTHLNNFSAPALSKARKKLPDNLFYDINKNLHSNFTELANNIYAIDGSKVHVPERFSKFGYKTRTNDKDVPRKAKRYIGMLSTLTGIKSDTIIDYSFVSHFNERTCVESHLKCLKKDDIVSLDRGYYSARLYKLFYDSGVIPIMRLKKTANRDVMKFYKSKKTDLKTNIVHNGSIIPIRYVKYFIDGNKYIIATSSMTLTIDQIKTYYGYRWRAEIAFRRLKSNLNLDNIRAYKPELYIQHIQFRILCDSLTRIIQSHIFKNTKSKNKRIKRGYISYKLLLYYMTVIYPKPLPRNFVT